jgi:hypothetical protein
MEEENKTSKFSSGLNIIIRLDGLWRNCQNLKRNGQYRKWNEELDTIWLELARDLKPAEYEDTKNKDGTVEKGYKSKFKEFDERISKELPFMDNYSSFKAPPKDSFIKRKNQYEILMEKQLFLSRLENKLNKGTTYEEEDDDF